MPIEHSVLHLASIIAAHLREWDPSPPFVELAIFDSGDSLLIARAIDAFCLEHLGAPVARGIFYQSSIGSVTGVELEDERQIVIKAHQPDRTRDFLAEIGRIQSHLAERGVFAPRIVAGPLSLGKGHAMVESFIGIGATADAHRPEIRRALARGLRSIVATCASLVPSTTLGPGLLAVSATKLWPKPHSRLFDFEATSRGAEWIDEIAARARQSMAPAGARVISHIDWRQEHVRFVGEEPVAAFDWDSLCCDFEPALLGFVAHAFCADWSRETRAQVPTLQESLAFISDYEEARGNALSVEERRLSHACLVYACAYSARCGHVPGRDDRATDGTFQHFLWAHGAHLLQM
jgi:Phosphotransferase enzyme family